MLTGYASLINIPKPTRSQDPAPTSTISRLLAAAVVNKNFRDLLLADPVQALAQGYQGEMFSLDYDERNRVLSIQADSLREFARQLSSHQEDRTQRWSAAWIPVKRNTLVLETE